MSRHLTIIDTSRRPPSLPARVWNAIRSYTSGPLSLKSPELARLFYGVPSGTGVTVTEQTALSSSAVWSATTLIAAQVAALPLNTYRRLPNGGRERAIGHPLYRLLHDEPNLEMSSMAFRETLQGHLLLWGNAFAEIVRDGAGRPKHLWPITPDRVHVQRDSAGRLVYRVTNPGKPDVVLDAADMLHIPGLGFDGVTGYSVVTMARESIALGIAAERFGGTFFGNGASFGGVFEHPGRMSEQARKNFIDSINSRHQGVDRAHKVMVAEEGMKYVRTGIPPEDAQFLQTRQFQVEEIARWFNVPPHKIGDLSHATYSNIEQQSIEFVTTTLMPWLRRWEGELNRKLIGPGERDTVFVEHLVDGLLRGDAAARGQFYRELFNMGALSPNDIRRYENMNPIEGGDVYMVQANLQTLDAAARVDDIPAQRDYPAAQNDQERRRCHVLAQQMDVVDKQMGALGKLKLQDESAASTHPSYHRAGRSLEVARDELRVFGVSSESRVAVELQNATEHVRRLADAVGVTEAPLLLGARRKLLQQLLRDPAQESRHAEAKKRAEWLRSLPPHLRLKAYKQESVERTLARGDNAVVNTTREPH